ncbi:MAG: sugar ABC transporter ATP-binding protein [Lacrimispora sp.]|uniref:sugar ABC transporter ATP-binding protein n=1 Tax=Lacrimispora sp. TaxID=2719234 RepID=UPI0039E2E23F
MEYVLEMQNICKSFPGVVALDGAELKVRKGEVHALMGENGAGKSTLIKVLGGIYHAEKGDIYIDGKKVTVDSVIQAERLGISIIHQEISLVNNMTIAENIYLGREPQGKSGLYSGRQTVKQAREILKEMNLESLDPERLVGTLSIAQMQMVEIVRAVSKDPKIIVMDEPTASLTDREVDSLFACIEKLKKKGVAIIYVSHRMNEVFHISDMVTVFRDSKYIGTKAIGETTPDDIIKMMVGRELTDLYAGEIQYGTTDIFEVKNLKNKYLKDVSFAVKKGEVFGISGLVGARRTELARAIFGIDKLDSGTILLEGKKVNPRNTKEAIERGISLVPEDRKKEGLILAQTVKFNMSIAVLDKFIHGVNENQKAEEAFVEENIKLLSIKTPGTGQTVKNLSGGNQQKVVISKWLATKPRVLILDEPTRGVDVGAKAEIYGVINDIAKQGVAVIMISSDLPEVINMSSRIAVMHEGRLVKILDSKTDDITQTNIMFYATGGKK